MKIKIDNIAQEALKLAIKAIRFSKGGFTNQEKKELADDLLALAILILTDVADG